MSAIDTLNLQDHLLTVGELARFLNVHKETIRRWIREEKFPAFRVGRQFKVDPNQAATWLSVRKLG